MTGIPRHVPDWAIEHNANGFITWRRHYVAAGVCIGVSALIWATYDKAPAAQLASVVALLAALTTIVRARVRVPGTPPLAGKSGGPDAAGR